MFFLPKKLLHNIGFQNLSFFLAKLSSKFCFAVDDDDTDSEDSLSDTEYPDSKAPRCEEGSTQALLVEKSLQNDVPAMGEWERHTRVRLEIKATIHPYSSTKTVIVKYINVVHLYVICAAGCWCHS